VTEETPTIPPPPAQPSEAKERPAHRRSIFFEHEARIRELVTAGYSYRQVLCILKLKKMHRSVLARWCARQGLASRATSSSNPTLRRADKKSASASSPVAPTVPPAPTPRPPLADAYGPEPSDPLADLRPTTPRSNP